MAKNPPHQYGAQDRLRIKPGVPSWVWEVEELAGFLYFINVSMKTPLVILVNIYILNTTHLTHEKLILTLLMLMSRNR